MTMNERAWRLADDLEARAAESRVAVSKVGGARVIDCGGAVDGSLHAGLMLARVCLADLGTVTLVPGDLGPMVQVTTDDPVRACLASQYAGWQIKLDNYFAMASGPMRAAAAREELFQHIHIKDKASYAVGVLESKHHPTEDVITHIVGKLPTNVEKLTLLVAPTGSIAGTLQVVARSVETALHKLHELKFDVNQVLSGYGVAPLPPVAKDDLHAIGWTNDALLYGGRVTLWVKCDDELLEAIGPKVPSSASADHGVPFGDLLKRVGGEFYRLDPLLFAPAEITFVNLKSGRSRTFGKCEPDLLRKSFAS